MDPCPPCGGWGGGGKTTKRGRRGLVVEFAKTFSRVSTFGLTSLTSHSLSIFGENVCFHLKQASEQTCADILKIPQNHDLPYFDGVPLLGDKSSCTRSFSVQLGINHDCWTCCPNAICCATVKIRYHLTNPGMIDFHINTNNQWFRLVSQGCKADFVNPQYQWTLRDNGLVAPGCAGGGGRSRHCLGGHAGGARGQLFGRVQMGSHQTSGTCGGNMGNPSKEARGKRIQKDTQSLWWPRPRFARPQRKLVRRAARTDRGLLLVVFLVLGF